MSWDVLLLRLPDDLTSVQEIPDDHTPDPLGRRRDVLAAVARACPETDLSDPAWGELSGPTWSIELNWWISPGPRSCPTGLVIGQGVPSRRAPVPHAAYDRL